ncbi:MAG: hypothetical protein A2Y25_01390 [Candidatus Melainabacteria bacterium GWF2_37_15]|nr:MAG: hypothetical protein A2Y25_01390 [Candidatus Melainabacteria bacterium GWF2_37_15]
MKTIYNNLTVSNNPIVSHNLAIIRDKNTNPEIFRASLLRISRIIMSKAFVNVPMTTKKVETPLMETEVRVIDTTAEFIIAPVLRTGLVFSEIALDLLPFARVHHIGLYRDEETLKPVPYYNKLPRKFKSPDDTYVYILDPMLATGGSGSAAIQLFTDLGVLQKNITFISLISSPEGIDNVFAKFPDIKLITGAIDETLNNVGYILPGLGDAGDRTFNT